MSSESTQAPSENVLQQLSAILYKELVVAKYSHLFALPLTLNAAMKLDALYSADPINFNQMIKESEYWQKFKPV